MNKKLLLELYNEKKRIKGKKLSNSSRYSQIVLNDIKNYIESTVASADFNIKASVGRGQYAEVPWITVLSKNVNVTIGPQKGIYIVLLFAKDEKHFELALSQGITDFEEREGLAKDRRILVSKVVDYFREEISEDLLSDYGFSKKTISLGNNLGKLARGYIQTTIVSKKYYYEEFDELDFIQSLGRLIVEYREIIDNIGTKTYDEVIESIIPKDYLISSIDAIEEINKAIDKDFFKLRDTTVVPVEVAKTSMRENKYRLLSKPKTYKKIDYIEKSKRDSITGLTGEEIALQIERKRIEELNLDPDIYVKYVAEISDAYGYDILSVDYFNGKLEEIYIEVKTTRDIKDTDFYVTRNEKMTSDEKGINYQIFRIYDVTSRHPKYYRSNGPIEDNFYLDPYTYIASNKFNVR